MRDMELRMESREIYPLVSVIIPCYNRERFIVETLGSVLDQTWPNIELIVVDDGCTDGSRTILESYGQQLILLEHPERVNKGQSAAINLGLLHCKGDYVAILDSDDLFAPDKIEKQISYLLDNPEIGLVYANGYAIDEKGNILYEFYDDSHKEMSDANKVLMDCYFLLPNNALIRREALELAGYFDENLRAAQDHDMAIRIAEVTELGYIGEHLFYYRRHKDSISHKNAKRRWKNGYKILHKAYKRYDYPIKTILGRLAVLNFRLGQCFFEEKRYIRAVLLFIAAGICDPIRSMRVLLGREKVYSPH
jgi:glycosyltransferase involved in cell wall biosynthesis